jgi:hypothetical protein
VYSRVTTSAIALRCLPADLVDLSLGISVESQLELSEETGHLTIYFTFDSTGKLW